MIGCGDSVSRPPLVGLIVDGAVGMIEGVIWYVRAEMTLNNVPAALEVGSRAIGFGCRRIDTHSSRDVPTIGYVITFDSSPRRLPRDSPPCMTTERIRLEPMAWMTSLTG